MAARDYDSLVLAQYRKIAQEAGSDSTSTMPDQRTRQLETELICDFVARAVRRLRAQGKREEEIQLVDVGCGNGYTLQVLSGQFPKLKCVGFEYTPELRKIAAERFPDGTVQVVPADIRNPNFAEGRKAHIAICQRVLINLLDPADQADALNHIVQATAPGGYLLFIEAFQSGLDRLNEARAEFDLDPIPTVSHNLFLWDGFFSQRSDLQAFQDDRGQLSPNFLSTHYFVSRVFHAVVLGDRPMKRNSHWVKFFSRALPPEIGDYSPVRAYAFERSDGPSVSV